MSSKINPFKPNSPVPIGMFAGRLDELKQLEKGLQQTRHGQPINFLMTGDRGIGKSSLMLYLAGVAAGRIKGFDLGQFNFAVINVPISDRMVLVALLKLLESALADVIGETETARAFIKDTWEFLQRVKIMDSSIDRAERDTEEEVLINKFAGSLAKTMLRVTQDGSERRLDGLLIILDEADNAIPDLRIGYFLKTLTESLQRHGCDCVMFVVAGLPETADKLRISHASSLRIFQPMKITELEMEERRYVVDRGLEKANELNADQTIISAEAKDEIASLSEGYPHFIQQFAYSAFDRAGNDEITKECVLDSAFAEGGAIDAIGSRYYESDFYDKIRSDEYRQVLAIMAKRENAWVKKSEIRSEFEGTETKLTNALQALSSRRIILKNPARDGEYRLQQKGFALWIQLFGTRAASSKRKRQGVK